MNDDFSLLATEELVALFHKINAELVKEFNNHADLSQQQFRIDNLSRISAELSKRKGLANSLATIHEEQNPCGNSLVANLR
jgi:hypothetical protein